MNKLSSNTAKRILELIEILRKKPNMVFSNEVNYFAFKTYIEGYIQGLSFSLSFSLAEEITIWFKQQKNIQMSSFWTNYIPIYYGNKTDEELKSILLDLFEEYLTAAVGKAHH